MGYFPVLRGKRFELAALRDLDESLVEWSSIVPIIEPVKRGGLAIALNELIDGGVRFAFIANPRVGEFADRLRTVDVDFIEEYLDEYDNYYPAFYVDAATTSRQVSDFASRFEAAALFFITGTPPAASVRSIISAEPAYVAVRDGRVPIGVVEELSAAALPLIRITDPFQRQVRNSDYPDREFFSDAHIRIATDQMFDHFGDYSIVGDAYTEGGGAAYTVALHHVVASDVNSDSLDIAHYKSEFRETTADIAGKFLEALQLLIEDQADAEPRNVTAALDVYRELFEEEHFPGLGFAKKLGLMQHLEVVANVIQ